MIIFQLTVRLILDALSSNVATNNAKVSSQWSNNGSEVHINQNVGIGTSNPDCNLEIGNGTANVKLRLGGQNGQTNSSEIIFADSISDGVNPEYFQGATIRFNSSNNRLEFLTDQGNDNSAELGMYIVRASSPEIYISNDLNVVNCSFLPLTKYCYGRRVNSLSDTDANIELTKSEQHIIYRHITDNGISCDTSTGVFTVDSTGIYHVVATLQIDCGIGAESELQLVLQDGTNTNILKARTHVSRAESNNSTAMQLNMNAPARLATGVSYNFAVSSNNDGTGVIQNDDATNNYLMIRGLVLENSFTIPTNWGTAA